MNTRKLMYGVLVAAFLLIAALPLTALGAKEQAITGTRIQPSEATLAFFQKQGVDPQYVCCGKENMPAEQWQKIRAVLEAPDDTTKTNDLHDTLTSNIMADLHNADHVSTDVVYIEIGGSVWSHKHAK
jgi:hypothetical protein